MKFVYINIYKIKLHFLKISREVGDGVGGGWGRKQILRYFGYSP